MDKMAIIQKLEDTLANLRQNIEQHDSSSFSALADTLKKNFVCAKNNVMEKEITHKLVDTFKATTSDLEDALKKGDKVLTVKALTAMEKLVARLKSRVSDKKQLNQQEENDK